AFLSRFTTMTADLSALRIPAGCPTMSTSICMSSAASCSETSTGLSAAVSTTSRTVGIQHRLTTKPALPLPPLLRRRRTLPPLQPPLARQTLVSGAGLSGPGTNEDPVSDQYGPSAGAGRRDSPCPGPEYGGGSAAGSRTYGQDRERLTMTHMHLGRRGAI